MNLWPYVSDGLTHRQSDVLDDDSENLFWLLVGQIETVMSHPGL